MKFELVVSIIKPIIMAVSLLISTFYSHFHFCSSTIHNCSSLSISTSSPPNSNFTLFTQKSPSPPPLIAAAVAGGARLTEEGVARNELVMHTGRMWDEEHHVMLLRSPYTVW